jgi:BASS family bile acid:Na+ symporter
MDQLINILVMITLIEMMAAIGLGVALTELVSVVKDWRLLGRAVLANYVCVPAITVGLLFLFQAQSMVAVGFLILAVCPGAPFGPSLTAVAKGNVTVAVGLMMVLAGSSAIVAPLLLQQLLPLMSKGDPLEVDATKIVVTLLVTQLAPLAVGLAIRHWRPALADRLRKPADLVSKVLNLSTVAVILVVQFHLLLDIQARAFIGMLILLCASFAAGWVLCGPGSGNRRAMTLTTSLRNVGVGLVIATGSFAGTPAITATVVYGLIEIGGSVLLAIWWSRRI